MIRFRTLFFSSLTVINAFAADDTIDEKSISLDEIIVISNPKANKNNLLTPNSTTILTSSNIEKSNINSVKDISAYVSNLYIPQYGSKLTTAIYIRGIGSRTNNSVVGVYVDNVPYLDKSIYDFDLSEIERLEILRGPQSTLYGRNTMAGIINIYTKNPFDHEYTKATVSYGNYNSVKANLVRYGNISKKTAYSITAGYSSGDGYFNNIYKNEKADSYESANGRVQLNFRPGETLKINIASGFEYSSQNGYPYGLINEDKTLEPVNYNDKAAYKRVMSANSIYLEKSFHSSVLTSTSGYQFFDDRMDLDQDFMPYSYFTLKQKQKQISASQEFILKSDNKSSFSYLLGAFGFYQKLNTNAPVNFKKDGIDNLINNNINIPPVTVRPGMTIILTDSLINNEMPIYGLFNTKSYGTAAFSRLSYDNLFFNGLSVSAGVRIDYEKSEMRYDSYTEAYAKGGVNVAGRDINFIDTLHIGFNGIESIEDLKILPRFDIRYTPNSKCMIYGTISKGFRAGGFNFQMFSDIIRDRLRTDMIAAFIKKAEGMGMGSNIPDNIHDMAKSAEIDIRNLTTYKPEYSWNYELGLRSEVLDKKLVAELALYYIDVRNQQVTDFSENGLGRITKNTGKSRSMGGELSLCWKPVSSLNLIANYGYTDARFVEYIQKSTINNEVISKDLSDYRIPFAPQHTFSGIIDYTLTLNKKFLNNINFNISYIGLGKIYWTEDNSYYQNIYGTLNGMVSFRRQIFELCIWSKNLTDRKYQSFYFESLGNKFAQLGAPRTFGADFSVRF